MSNQQQPRQWFRFGSFFQAAQQSQPHPNPPTTTTTQQPATRPSVAQPRQPAPITTPSQETPRPGGAPNEVPVQRFPIKPTLVSAPAPKLPNLPSAATPTPNPRPTQTVLPAVPQPRPLALQLAPRVETPPVPPTQRLGASNEATMNRSVQAPMPPSAPPQRFPPPPTSTPMPRSPPKAATPPRSPPLPFTTSTTVHSFKLQPSEATNASTPYLTPISRTPPSMQTSPNKKASPGTVSIRSSSLPASPERKLSEPPPSEFDQAEQKSVLVQETLDKSKVIPTKPNVHDQTSMGTAKNKNGVKEKGKTIPKKPHDSEKLGTRLILTGVNRGAVMDLSNTDKKESSGFQGNGKKLGNVLDGGKEETSNPNMEDKTHKKGMSIHSSTLRAFMNSNVQGINNSIAFNSSFKEKDPGVHLRFSRKGNIGREEIPKKDHSI